MNMPPLRYKPACTSASQVVCLPNSRAHIKIQKNNHALGRDGGVFVTVKGT